MQEENLYLIKRNTQPEPFLPQNIGIIHKYPDYHIHSGQTDTSYQLAMAREGHIFSYQRYQNELSL